MCLEIEKLLNEKFAEGRAEAIFNLMKNTNMNFEEATNMVGCSEEEANALKPLVDAMITAEK